MARFQVHRGQRRPIRTPRTLHAEPAEIGIEKLRAEWLAALEEMGVRVGRLPFTSREAARAIWLPASGQALFLAESASSDVRRRADEIHMLIGDRGHDDPIDGTDLRVILALPAGRFFGLRGGMQSIYADAVDCNRCARCNAWWFCMSWSGWQCRCCGEGGGNGHIVEQITRFPMAS